MALLQEEIEPKWEYAYYRERIEPGCWVDLELTADSAIQVKIYGDNNPSIFNVNGTRFNQTHILLTNPDNWYVGLINRDSFPKSVSGDIWIRQYIMTDVAVTKYRFVLNPMRLTYGILTSIIGVVIIAVFLTRKASRFQISRCMRGIDAFTLLCAV